MECAHKLYDDKNGSEWRYNQLWFECALRAPKESEYIREMLLNIFIYVKGETEKS